MGWPANLSTLLLTDNRLYQRFQTLNFDDLTERSGADPLIGCDDNAERVPLPAQLTTTLHRHFVFNIAASWRRTTLIDLLAYERPLYQGHLREFIGWWTQHVGGHIYATTQTDLAAEGIVIDPVFEIYRLRQAETLVNALSNNATPLKQRTQLALTLLWASAQAKLNGESALRVLTDLSVAQHDLPTRTASLDKFRAAWRDSGLSAGASEPAWDAVELFAGTLHGADSLTDVHYTADPGGEHGVKFTPTAPTVTPVLDIYRDNNPALVLYDSRINPETPTILTSTELPTLTITADHTSRMPTRGYTIRVEDPLPSDPPRGDSLGPYCGLNPYGTQPRLDGWFGDRTLILMENGTAQRIYFPQGMW